MRALKMHGGGPPVVAGKPLDHTYKSENVELVSKGCCNLARHIANARAYGVPVVIAINKFASDTQAELDAVRAAALEAGMRLLPHDLAEAALPDVDASLSLLLCTGSEGCCTAHDMYLACQRASSGHSCIQSGCHIQYALLGILMSQGFMSLNSLCVLQGPLMRSCAGTTRGAARALWTWPTRS